MKFTAKLKVVNIKLDSVNIVSVEYNMLGSNDEPDPSGMLLKMKYMVDGAPSVGDVFEFDISIKKAKNENSSTAS